MSPHATSNIKLCHYPIAPDVDTRAAALIASQLEFTPQVIAAKEGSMKIDVFCHVFGFDGPDYLGKMHVDEWRRREAAVIPPPSDFKRWYPSTLRAVLAELKRSGEA